MAQDGPATTQPAAPSGIPAEKADALWQFGPLDISSMFELLQRGGPVVAILGVLSLIALTVIVYKACQFLVCGVGRAGNVEAALTDWLAGNRSAAMSRLAGRRSPTAQVVHHAMDAIARGMQLALIREDAERVALEKLAALRSHLRILESTSQLAPLLGLFGTVIGMVSAFQALQSSGAEADPAALAGGIWVALITTAVGLAIAIPTAFSLYWFEGRLDRETAHMEASLTSLFTARLSGQGPNLQADIIHHLPEQTSAAE